MKSEEALVLEQDPASDRLGAATVIEIHQLHRKNMPWSEIAERTGVTRKTVQRIVQGRRHRGLHPMVRPELYETAATMATFTYTQEQIDEAWRVASRAFQDHLLHNLAPDDGR